MGKISSSQRSFIQLMKGGEDYERRGFELLLQRSDFPDFFDALADEGLFDPSRNSGPVEADKPGYYRVPFWPPLRYLEAVAPARRRTGRRHARRQGDGSHPHCQPMARQQRQAARQPQHLAVLRQDIGIAAVKRGVGR